MLITKYTLKDGELVKVDTESDKTVDDMIKRTYSEPVQYEFNHYYLGGGYGCYKGKKNKDNSIFLHGLGTKSFTPSRFTKWDSTRKCFVWTNDQQPFIVYDAKNVRLTNRGFYFSTFDVSKLPDAKNKKANKKRYALLNTYCEDLLADCKMWDNKAISEPTFDYTRDDRLNEFRAVWAVRQLLTKAFKENKRISAHTLTEMFINTDYSSEYQSQIYTFGGYMTTIGTELIDYLTAETEKHGQLEIGHSDSDDGRP